MGHGDLECSTPVQRNTLGKLLPYNVMVRALEEKKEENSKHGARYSVLQQ
jgi:hypothetical protein